MTEFNLSKKIFKEMGEGIFWIKEKDIKEFIRKINDDLGTDDNDWTTAEVMEIIKRRAGRKLT